MEKLYLKDYEELMDEICKSYEKHFHDKHFYEISVVAKYDVMIKLLNKFVKATNFNMLNIHLEEPDIDDYEDEWIMSVTKDNNVWVEKAKREPNEFNDGGYIFVDDSVTFVHKDVSNDFINQNKNSKMIMFYLGAKKEKNIEDKYIVTKCDINPIVANEIIKELTELTREFTKMSKSLSNIFDW